MGGGWGSQQVFALCGGLLWHQGHLPRLAGSVALARPLIWLSVAFWGLAGFPRWRCPEAGLWVTATRFLLGDFGVSWERGRGSCCL